MEKKQKSSTSNFAKKRKILIACICGTTLIGTTVWLTQCSGYKQLSISGDRVLNLAAYESYTGAWTANGPDDTGYTWNYVGDVLSGMSFNTDNQSNTLRFNVTSQATCTSSGTITVSHAGYTDASLDVTINIDNNTGLNIIGDNVLDLTAYTDYTGTWTANGPDDTGYTWTYIGSVPTGMNLDTDNHSNILTLSGTPEEDGTSSGTITVSHAGYTDASLGVTIIIANNTGLNINGANDLNLTAHTDYTGTWTANGSVYTGYTWDYDGDVPSGMSFNTDSQSNILTLSGTPEEDGTFSGTITVSHAGYTDASLGVTIIIANNTGLNINGANDLNLTAYTDYTGTWTANGPDDTGYTWNYVGDVPSGMSFNTDSQSNILTLSGTPKEDGTFSGTITVSHDSYTDASLNITINIANNTGLNIIGASTSDIPPHNSTTKTWTANGPNDIGYTWAYMGDVPTGMNLNTDNHSKTLTLSGTASVIKSYRGKITVSHAGYTDANLSVIFNVQIPINTYMGHIANSNAWTTGSEPSSHKFNCSGFGYDVLEMNFPSLTSLDCSNNSLKYLSTNTLTSLQSINCSNNNLIYLDLLVNRSLNTIHCGNNPQLSAIILPDYSVSTTIDLHGNEGTWKSEGRITYRRAFTTDIKNIPKGWTTSYYG